MVIAQVYAFVMGTNVCKCTKWYVHVTVCNHNKLYCKYYVIYAQMKLLSQHKSD